MRIPVRSNADSGIAPEWRRCVAAWHLDYVEMAVRVVDRATALDSANGTTFARVPPEADSSVNQAKSTGRGRSSARKARESSVFQRLIKENQSWA